MKLWKMLLSDIYKAEREANQENYLPPTRLKRAIYIKINPRVFHDLLGEQAAALKENKLIMPYIRSYITGNHDFFGIPLSIDWKVERWEVVV